MRGCASTAQLLAANPTESFSESASGIHACWLPSASPACRCHASHLDTAALLMRIPHTFASADSYYCPLAMMQICFDCPSKSHRGRLLPSDAHVLSALVATASLACTYPSAVRREWTSGRTGSCTVALWRQRLRTGILEKCGADPQEKIDTKYTSIVAHNYKMALEKDVADACRIGLDALMHESSSMSGAGATPAAPSDPFADYINSLQPKKATSLGAINVLQRRHCRTAAQSAGIHSKDGDHADGGHQPFPGQWHADARSLNASPTRRQRNATTPSLAAAPGVAPAAEFQAPARKKAGLGGAVAPERRPAPTMCPTCPTPRTRCTVRARRARVPLLRSRCRPRRSRSADPAPTHPAARIAATTPFHSATAAAGAKPASTLKPLSSLGSLQKSIDARSTVRWGLRRVGRA